MKIKIIILAFLLTASAYALSATYKVTPGGKVTNPQGVQTKVYTTRQNFYSNYSSQNYVNQNVINQNPTEYVEIVMDFSGSMTAWVEEAKKTMSKILSQIPSSTNIGFRVFGQKYSMFDNSSRQASVKNIQQQGSKFIVKTKSVEDISNSCDATKQVAKILPNNYSNLINGMNSVSLGGSTPMVLALERAYYNDFATVSAASPKKIVLITDGGENCGGDPCAFARQIAGKGVQVDVVLVSSNSRYLSCLSSATGGNFYTLDNISDFSKTITRSINTTNNNSYQEPQQSYEFIND